jgi:hypothetical protein
MAVRSVAVPAVSLLAAYVVSRLLWTTVLGHSLFPDAGSLWATWGLPAVFTVVTGALVGLSRRWNLSVTSAVGVVVTLAAPWLLPTATWPDSGHSVVAFVLTGLALIVEADLRRSERTEHLLTDDAGRTALAVGAVHFGVGFTIQEFVRRFVLFSGELYWLVIVWCLYVIAGLGLLATGTLPVLLWQRARLLTPALATGSWFLWGLTGLWEMQAVLPLSSFSAVAWASAYPYPDYLLQWPPLLAVSLILAAVEWTVRERPPSARTTRA